MNEENTMREEYDFSGAVKNTLALLKNDNQKTEPQKETAEKRQVEKQTLNRAQRRAQEKRLRALAKKIERREGLGKSSKDLTPEELLAVKLNMLEKLKAENAKFDAMKEKESKNEND